MLHTETHHRGNDAALYRVEVPSLFVLLFRLHVQSAGADPRRRGPVYTAAAADQCHGLPHSYIIFNSIDSVMTSVYVYSLLYMGALMREQVGETSHHSEAAEGSSVSRIRFPPLIELI